MISSSWCSTFSSQRFAPLSNFPLPSPSSSSLCVSLVSSSFLWIATWNCAGHPRLQLKVLVQSNIYSNLVVLATQSNHYLRLHSGSGSHSEETCYSDWPHSAAWRWLEWLEGFVTCVQLVSKFHPSHALWLLHEISEVTMWEKIREIYEFNASNISPSGLRTWQRFSFNNANSSSRVRIGRGQAPLNR